MGLPFFAHAVPQSLWSAPRAPLSRKHQRSTISPLTVTVSPLGCADATTARHESASTRPSARWRVVFMGTFSLGFRRDRGKGSLAWHWQRGFQAFGQRRGGAAAPVVEEQHPRRLAGPVRVDGGGGDAGAR